MKDNIDLYNALKHMKNGQRMRLDAKTQTIFAYHQEKIDVHTEHAHFVMTEEDFIALYQDANFLSYTKKPNIEIEADKDEVYYTQWKK
jgi:hypothetical protein